MVAWQRGRDWLVKAEHRLLLAALLVSSAVALVTALVEVGLGVGSRGGAGGLIGLLIAGPLLAAVGLGMRQTAMVGVYTLGLALLAGVPVTPVGFGSGEHLAGLVVVATGSVFAVLIAHQRGERERALARISRVAEVAQRAILRPIPARVGRAWFQTRYLSASQDALVGGDFYDVAPTPYGLRVLVGDVKGKGVEAVRVASLVLGCFRTACALQPTLTGLAAELNQTVTPELGDEEFATLILAELGRHGELCLVNLGHPPPLLVRGGTNAILPLAAKAPTTPLGLSPSPVMDRFELARDDRLLLSTDGLIEARNPAGQPFVVDARAAAVLAAPSLRAALDGLVRLLVDHVGGQLGDDLALVLLQPRRLTARRTWSRQARRRPSVSASGETGGSANH